MCISASHLVYVISGLSFEEVMVYRLIFGLCSPVVCVFANGVRLWQILVRFVVFVGCVFVYGVLACLI